MKDRRQNRRRVTLRSLLIAIRVSADNAGYLDWSLCAKITPLVVRRVRGFSRGRLDAILLSKGEDVFNSIRFNRMAKMDDTDQVSKFCVTSSLVGGIGLGDRGAASACATGGAHLRP